MAKKKKSKLRKVLQITALLIVAASIIAGFIFWDAYKKAFSVNLKLEKETTYLFIPTGSNFDDLVNILSEKEWGSRDLQKLNEKEC